MPAPKKALPPASRAKADKRNERDKAKRAAKAAAAASGGTTSGKKRKATPDLAEEEMTSSGGSWERSGELLFALLEEKQERHFEAGKLELAEEKSTFYERSLGLQDEYVKYLEWRDEDYKGIRDLYNGGSDKNMQQYQQIIELEFENENLKEQQIGAVMADAGAAVPLYKANADILSLETHQPPSGVAGEGPR
jgi:hypothetical protein